MSKMIELKHRFDTLEEVLPMVRFFNHVTFEDWKQSRIDGYILHDDVVLMSYWNGEDDTTIKEVTLDALKDYLVHSVTIYERYDDAIEDDIQHLMIELKNIDFDSL